MRHFRRRILLNSFKLADIFIMVASFGVAMVSEQQTGGPALEHFFAMRISILNLIMFLVLMLLWQTIFTVLGLYYSMRLSSRWSEAIAVLKATTIGTVTIYVGAVLFDVLVVTPLFLFVFWSVSTVFIVILRLVLRNFLGRVRGSGRNLRNIILVGTNQRAIQFAETILRKPHLGYSLVGFVDGHWQDADQQMQEKYPLVPLDKLGDFIRNNVVDEVMICLPLKEYYNQHQIITDICSEQGIIVRILADFFFSQLAHARVEYFEGSSVITIYTGVAEGLHCFLKRVIDIVLSLLLLVGLSPMFFVIALVIKFSSPGPVLFVQERLGLNKRMFNMYKFRTMVENAESLQKDLEQLNEAAGPVFKIKNDPRITREGRFLRMTSLDEFPQLLNVLMGDMSLVGPRPLPVRDYMGFDQRWFNRRFSVRPGMTCLWQIDGRSDIPFEQWIQLDLRYIDTWSLILDFQILLGTIPAVLKCKGAS
jgi:exopolysaccharide biosynthesis polyprenyl glycosylphosphotransferase